MIITPEIRNAIKCLQDAKALTSDGLAKLVGVAQSSANSWVNGNAKSIRPANWAKLKHYLDPFLPEDHFSPGTHYSKVESNAEFVAEPLPTYPVISLAAAVEASGMVYMPIDEYAELNAEQRLSFSAGQPGDFVIRVSGDSMLPWYPPGTHILVRPGSSVKTGNRCVAILADGEVVFKVFVERKTTWLLAAINGDGGKNYVFKKGDVKSVRGIYRVIQSMRTEEDLDKAMQEAGQHHFWEMLLDEDRDGENGLKPNGVENEGDMPKVQG